MSRLAARLAVVATAVFMTLPSFAQQMEGGDLVACEGIANQAARLACYDAAVQRFKARFGTSRPDNGAGAATEVPGPETSPSPASEDAAMTSGSTTVVVEETFESEITETRAQGRNTLVALGNGTVWRDTDGSKLFRPEVGDKVQVTRNAMGGYYMKHAGRTANVRLVSPRMAAGDSDGRRAVEGPRERRTPDPVAATPWNLDSGSIVIPARFEAEITDVRKQGRTTFVALNNETVWRDSDGQKFFMPKIGEKVEVRRGLTGGYRMTYGERGADVKLVLPKNAVEAPGN